MKLPSLSKTAKHKTFSYRPRYFDPAMDDLEQRVKATEAEIAAEKSGVQRLQRIREVYRKRNSNNSRRTDLTQAGFVVFFLLFVWAYYEYGNHAFILTLFLPVYILRRMRKR